MSSLKAGVSGSKLKAPEGYSKGMFTPHEWLTDYIKPPAQSVEIVASNTVSTTLKTSSHLLPNFSG